MAGIAAVIVQILPESPKSNLEEIKNKAKEQLEELGAKNISFEEIPLAFGLKELKVKFAWPEEKDTDLIENTLSTLPEVNSVRIEDYRRAFG